MEKQLTWFLVTLLSYGMSGGNDASAQLVNVALEQFTTQSTTGFGLPGDNAVDGNLGSITHTDTGDLAPFWEVNLGAEFDIEHVDVFNRTDCCGERFYNVTVEIFDASSTLVYTSPVFNPWDGVDPIPADPGGGPFNFDLTGEPGGSVTGQRVRINKTAFSDSEWLSLGEVEVWAPLSNLSIVSLTVDRDTGALTLSNNSSSAIHILGYKLESGIGALDQAGWTPISGNYDVNGNGSVDSDDAWSVFTNPGVHTDLSEGELEGGNGGTIAHGQSVNLGSGAWIKNVEEDLQLRLLHTDGAIKDVTVAYSGNSNASFARSDLDFNGVVNELDWPLYLAGLEADLSGLSPAEAYQMGDLDYDGVNSVQDFLLFKSDFEAAQGAGAFAAMIAGQSVPEPSSLGLLLLGGLFSLFSFGCARLLPARWRVACRYGLRASCIVTCAALSLTAIKTGHAQLVNVALGKSTTQTTTFDDNVVLYGSHKAVDGIYDQSNTNITSTATGDITPYWEVNLGSEFDIEHVNVFNRSQDHEPDDWSILSYNITIEIFDASNTSVYTSSVFNPWTWSEANPQPPSAGLDPFIVDLTGEPSGSVTGQTVRVSKAVEFDGSSASVLEYVSLREVEVLLPLENVPRIGLQVDRTTGDVSLVNNFAETFSTDFYRITSESSSLNAASWNSLDAQNFDSIGGAEGESWGVGGGIDTGETQVDVLAEAFLQGSSTFAMDASQSLGAAYNTSVDAQDLVFEYHDSTTDEVLQGFVEYVTSVAIEGDYNGNGVVDAADYTLWRDSLTQTGAGLPADGNGDMVVDAADYDYWKERFGNTSGSGAALTAVPEPSLLALACSGLACLTLLTRHRGRATNALLLVAALGVSSVATAEVTIDRDYTFGEDALEGPSQGAIVGSNNTSPLAASNTADGIGPNGAFLDLTQHNDPTYQDVDSVDGLGRPGAGEDTYGVRFDGTEDYLDGIPLNRPDELAGSVGIGPLVPGYPFNYDGITARGLQMWVYPDAAKVGNGRQGILMDTIAAGGVAITADGQWTQINDGHSNDTDIGATVDVVGNQWYHVMQHVYPSGDPGSPRVVPDTGSDDLEFTGVVYVNGIAVSANNDTPLPGDLTSGSRVGKLIVGAEEVSGDGVNVAVDNHFQGVIDDLQMYVFGDNTDQGGQNYGTFDLFVDNEWIADEISNTVPGGVLTVGDINLNGEITSADAGVFISNWLREKRFEGAHNDITVGDWETWGWGDLDRDGVVDLPDAFILHQALLTATGSGLDFGLLGSTPIPEPTALLLAAMGLSTVGAMRLVRQRQEGHGRPRKACSDAA